MQTGNQIESQSESFSTMPVKFAQNPKDFQSPDDVFNFHPFACQFSIDFLFLFFQLMQFAVLQWQNHNSRLALQPPISQIGTHLHGFAKLYATRLKQFVIVRFAFPEKRRHNSFRFFVNHTLRFQRVPLFLARIKLTLFFFGRSIKPSVTSTIVYLSESSANSCFLPGKANLPDLIKISSIRRTSRETFDSCKFQSHPK